MIRYFTDPVLQDATIGSMLMCLSSALIGVLVFLRKRSLLGEALSHAAYPGVVASVWIGSTLALVPVGLLPLLILIGASVSALAGLWMIDWLDKRFRVKSDAALCLVLSVFFGVGVLLASYLQSTHALSARLIQVFLYGQAATLMHAHVIVYAILAAVTVIALCLFHHPLRILLCDPSYAKSIGMRAKALDSLVFALLVFAIVIGMRSMGVVLMAGMLIAPAVGARQWTHRLSWLFALAGLFGAISGFVGNYLSVEIPRGFSLPTGPMILLCASTIALFSLLFAPSRGVLSRCWRIFAFRQQCRAENILKYLWKQGDRKVELKELQQRHSLSSIWIHWLMHRLKKQGWVKLGMLTEDGRMKGERLVRLHRLWEVYLVSLGQGREKVHCSAEEMEHILTADIEKELTALLNDPRYDPHHQPIPRQTEGV